jgi:16S rRNA (uracil1498-N3)-methyltransferase
MPAIPRLYMPQTLDPGSHVMLDEARAHYVRHVMRLADGDHVMLFNAEDGQWEASVELQGKRSVQLSLERHVSAPRACPDVWLAFALIKNKSELVVEKATELGVREVHAIVTQHAVVKHANMEKLKAHAVEAAEQCERHDIPSIMEHKNLANFLGSFPLGRVLLYGDETGTGEAIDGVLADIHESGLCILIGPEGGFSADEHHLLKIAPFARPFSMGPRILRADTAAVAALACVMSAFGDWQQRPHFKGIL